MHYVLQYRYHFNSLTTYIVGLYQFCFAFNILTNFYHPQKELRARLMFSQGDLYPLGEGVCLGGSAYGCLPRSLGKVGKIW